MTPTSTAGIATISAMRAPYRRRLSVSRPSWSVPSQCSDDGPVRRLSTSMDSGLYGAMTGANRAAATMMKINRKPSSPVGSRSERMNAEFRKPVRLEAGAAMSARPYARVHQAVRKVGQEVRKAVEEYGDDERTLHDRVIARFDRVQDQVSESGPVEDQFDEHRPAEQVPEADTDDDNDGDECAPQRVAEQHGAAVESLRCRCPHVVLAELLEHRRAHEPGDVTDPGEGQSRDRQHEVPELVHDVTAISGATDGKPAELDGEEQQQEQARHERRHRDGCH